MEELKTRSYEINLFTNDKIGEPIVKEMNELKKDDEITIISPFIDKIIIEEWNLTNDIVLELLKKGVKVTIITKKDTIYNTKQENIFKNLNFINNLKFNIYMIIFILISFFINYYPINYFIRSIYIIYIFLVILSRYKYKSKYPNKNFKKYIKYENFKLYVYNSEENSIIHSKIFNFNSKDKGKFAFLGSMNFTYTGFYKNIETRIFIKDNEKIKNQKTSIELIEKVIEIILEKSTLIKDSNDFYNFIKK